MNTPLVSVITPFLNGAPYLKRSIGSVYDQTYSNWELILINDGSTDNSEEIATAFSDPRVRYFKKENSGVSASRNLGLAEMKGDFFCFLDVDDELPPNSIQARLKVFEENDQIHFVDGVVHKKDAELNDLKEVWTPAFQGAPLEDLIRLTGKSFFGPSWMIKRLPDVQYQFKEGLTHVEDLLFYLGLAEPGRQYGYTSEVILNYRVHEQSAMSNLDGLANGYHEVYQYLIAQKNIPENWLEAYREKVNRILTRSYLRKFNLLKALTTRI